MLAILLVMAVQATPAEEALRRRVQALDEKVREQEALIQRLLEKLPADDPLRASVALAAHPCAQNLRGLWALQFQYAVRFGGRMKSLPKETGADFWLALMRTEPPLLSPNDLGMLVCPRTRERARPGYTSYRGPSTTIGRIPGGDPVGCCEPDAHPDRSIVVLLKSGDVVLARPDDALYAAALEKTQGLPGRGMMTAVGALKTLASAEADFRANDRDGNREQDFWVGDVSGLHRAFIAPDRPARLIEAAVAAADAAPIQAPGLAKHAADAPRPYAGYLFVALKGWKDGATVRPYDGGGHRNLSRFGFAAYPAQYPTSGTLTYILSEGNTVFARDTGGKAPEAWPDDTELLRDWMKLD